MIYNGQKNLSVFLHMPASEFATFHRSLELDPKFNAWANNFVIHVGSGAIISCNVHSHGMGYVAMQRNIVNRSI